VSEGGKRKADREWDPCRRISISKRAELVDSSYCSGAGGGEPASSFYSI
jgi:hypothetical protein